MLNTFVLATVVGSASAFLGQFSGSWICGNAHYHEAWRIGAHQGPAVPGATLADVSYGDPAHPDGLAFVYYNPSEHAFHYDDFHADGAQSHLTSLGPVDGTWAWSGTYYPIGAAPDSSGYVTWTLARDGTIARVFAQRVGGKTINRGADRCVPAPEGTTK